MTEQRGIWVHRLGYKREFHSPAYWKGMWCFHKSFDKNYPGWVVSHGPSGYKIPRYFYTRSAANALRDYMAALPMINRLVTGDDEVLWESMLSTAKLHYDKYDGDKGVTRVYV